MDDVMQAAETLARKLRLASLENKDQITQSVLRTFPPTGRFSESAENLREYEAECSIGNLRFNVSRHL